MAYEDIWLGLISILELSPDVDIPRFSAVNPETGNVDILLSGARGGASPLILDAPLQIMSADWLTLDTGEAVALLSGDTISVGYPIVAAVPNFVMTTSGDVIAVGGM